MTDELNNFSLEEFQMAVDEILDFVRNKGLGDEFEDLVTRATNQALRLQDAQSKYAYFVDEYLSMKEPFSWNRKGARDLDEQDKHFRWDIKQYLTLIEYCLRAGGETQILDTWGIEYPLSHHGPGLAYNDLNAYVEVLASISNQDGITPEQKFCFEHLVQKLRFA